MKCCLKNGELIVKCIGVAAALGCGKSDQDVLSYCTCDNQKQDREADQSRQLIELEKRITKLENEIERLKRNTIEILP
jgi:cell division protein FtsB